MPLLVVTLVGPDRPGLVGTVSDVVRANDGNWLESRMSHLADQFAGIVLVETSEDSEAQLTQALQGLADQGLQVVVQANASGIGSNAVGDFWQINVVGNDRPGIVRELTQVLASHDVNVEDLATECQEAPVSGGRIFKAQARIQLPEGLQIELIQDELERLATDLMIDVSSPENAA